MEHKEKVSFWSFKGKYRVTCFFYTSYSIQEGVYDNFFLNLSQFSSESRCAGGAAGWQEVKAMDRWAGGESKWAGGQELKANGQMGRRWKPMGRWAGVES